MMTFAEFQRFVEENESSYRGVHPESEDALAEAEVALGFCLPMSLKWVLSQWGYSDGTGIDNFEEAVENTLRLREQCGLPAHILLLNDWGDSGVVWIDFSERNANGESPVRWSSGEDLLGICEGETLSAGTSRYDDYPAWSIDSLKRARDFSEYQRPDAG